MIEKDVVVRATLDEAWAAWTTREGITRFFAPDAKVEARVGGAFQICIDPGAQPGLQGADEMRFLALQPQKMISFDCNAPPTLPAARAQRTFVVVRFMPVDEQDHARDAEPQWLGPTAVNGTRCGAEPEIH